MFPKYLKTRIHREKIKLHRDLVHNTLIFLKALFENLQSIGHLPRMLLEFIRHFSNFLDSNPKTEIPFTWSPDPHTHIQNVHMHANIDTDIEVSSNYTTLTTLHCSDISYSFLFHFFKCQPQSSKLTSQPVNRS